MANNNFNLYLCVCMSVIWKIRNVDASPTISSVKSQQNIVLFLNVLYI